MTRCPVCSSLYQTIVVGPRTWGTCNDCGSRWVRESGVVHVVSNETSVAAPRTDSAGVAVTYQDSAGAA